MINFKKIQSYRIVTIAIFTSCLIISQVAMSASVNIDINSANQTIRGFGGMNFPRWIGDLTAGQADTAFGNGPGQIGLTMLRISVAPNSSDWNREVATALRAQSHGAIVFATPWSPPASMKTNNSTIQGELKTDAYDDYANYLKDFVNYMLSNGVSLYAISVQNEPDWLPNYESCGWSPTQIQTFLNNNASVIPTKVIAPEPVHYKSDYINAAAASPECDIIATHLYGGSITPYYGKEYWETEHYTSSDVSGDLWPDALNVGKEIHDCMMANMSAYTWWYIRRFYGPIDEDGHVTKRGYVMSHFSKFVRPGYTRIGATASPFPGVSITAYRNGTTLVIIAVNQNASSSDVTFSLSQGSVGSYTKYETTSSNNVSNLGSVSSTNTLAGYSINTFVGTISGAPDTSPPDPDPMTWANGGQPVAAGSSSITMTAETASDISMPVSYYFECTTDDSASSTWQTNPTYEATGLTPSTLYTFRVKARDKASAPNETQWSNPASSETDTVSTDIEILGDWTTGTTHTKEGGYSRALIFIAHGEMEGVMNLTSVTYGGRPMTKVVDRNYTSGIDAYAAAYILDEQGITAATHDIFNPVWSTIPAEIKYASVFLANVNQDDLIGDFDTAGGTTGTIATSSLVTDSGDMVIDAATCGNLGAYTLNNGFAQGTHESAISSTGVTGYKSAGGASETPSVTHSSVNRQALIGFVIRTAGVVGFQDCMQVQYGGYRLLSDFNRDCYVNFSDVEVFAHHWLDTDCAISGNCEYSDFEPDGDVDLSDFGNFGMQWMDCNNPSDPGCTPNW